MFYPRNMRHLGWGQLPLEPGAWEVLSDVESYPSFLQLDSAVCVCVCVCACVRGAFFFGQSKGGDSSYVVMLAWDSGTGNPDISL